MALRPQPHLVVRISDFDNEVKAIIGTYSLYFLPTYRLVTLLLKRQVVFVSRSCLFIKKKVGEFKKVKTQKNPKTYYNLWVNIISFGNWFKSNDVLLY